MTAPIRTMPELIAAMRARRDELQITHATIEDIGLLPDGYVSKVLAEKPIKNIGPKALEGLLDGLGVVLVLAPQPSARALSKWVKRKRPLKPALSITASIQNEVPLQLPVTPELQRLLHMRAIGIRGNLKRNEKLSRWKRRVLARRAAKARWAKRINPGDHTASI